ncbi:hypothetical protein HYT58_00335 [Candidatus Woesearchaeota archaeon]|nr:hypothetical protein [Candidatus Woesearchaeota archaeon]
MENLIKIQPDREKARSLAALADLRFNKLKVYTEEKEIPLIIEWYYEVIKELITSILFIDGYKTLSHKDLIKYLKINFKNDFSYSNVMLIDQLRRLRNDIVYYGVFTDSSYLKRNKQDIINVISKLFELCNKKLTNKP